MKYLFPALGLIALGLVAIPPCLYWSGSLTELAAAQRFMLIGTALWFVAAPLWMKAPR